MCVIYGLPGGIAECGSVFVDAVAGREYPLVDGRAAAQIAVRREAIRELPGVFLHASCRRIARAYRCNGETMVPLAGDEMNSFLQRHGLDLLCARLGSEYTDVGPPRNGKAHAMSAVNSLVGCADLPAAAIGDSETDVQMLDPVEFSYAPANCAKPVRDLAQKGRCRLLRKPYQRALFAAAQDSISRLCPNPRRVLLPSMDLSNSTDLVHEMMEVADRPRWRQLLSILHWTRL